MTRIARRGFLAGTVTTVSAAAMGYAGPPPSETVNIAVVGCGRGAALARWFTQVPTSQVVAVCDVDEGRARIVCDEVAAQSGKRPKMVADFRTLLERSDVDALAVATPDHWHALATVLACRAGLDVYVEKPCSHNVVEGRLAVAAARRHNRIVQHGTQLRSMPHYRAAWKLLHAGVIGKILMVKAINNQKRARMQQRPDEAVPAGVHYDLWLGPATKRPFNRNRFHGGWHWHWEYGTGDLGNDGVHQIDLGRWALGLGAPNAVSCCGAKLGSKGDAQETPDTMVVSWEYDNLLFVYEQRDFTPYRMPGHRLDNDNIFYGDEGFMMIDRDGYRVFYKDKRGPAMDHQWAETTAHYQNFVDCVKRRRRDELIADIEEGHRSALLCHLGNIAYRTGRRLEFDASTESFPHDEVANQYLTRSYRTGYALPDLS